MDGSLVLVTQNYLLLVWILGACFLGHAPDEVTRRAFRPPPAVIDEQGSHLAPMPQLPTLGEYLQQERAQRSQQTLPRDPPPSRSLCRSRRGCQTSQPCRLGMSRSSSSRRATRLDPPGIGLPVWHAEAVRAEVPTHDGFQLGLTRFFGVLPDQGRPAGPHARANLRRHAASQPHNECSTGGWVRPTVQVGHAHKKVFRDQRNNRR